ncbi:hypothetical protein [Actinomyces sp.]|nr:hypothetical protein [Actinomyces sp.]MDO4901687.1 hypothetical protein [Actinomyces sp.]
MSFIRSFLEYVIATLNNWKILSTGCRHVPNNLPDIVIMSTDSIAVSNRI